MGMLGSWGACTSLTRVRKGLAMVDDDFYEDDEPIEKIQEIRRRPPDFVTTLVVRDIKLEVGRPADIAGQHAQSRARG